MAAKGHRWLRRLLGRFWIGGLVHEFIRIEILRIYPNIRDHLDYFFKDLLE